MHDLISRAEVIDAVRSYYNECDTSDKTIEERIEGLRGQPAIEERKTGRWIHIRTEADGNALYECSECHKGEKHVPIVEVRYCWNCGAKMEQVSSQSG